MVDGGRAEHACCCLIVPLNILLYQLEVCTVSVRLCQNLLPLQNVSSIGEEEGCAEATLCLCHVFQITKELVFETPR